MNENLAFGSVIEMGAGDHAGLSVARTAANDANARESANQGDGGSAFNGPEDYGLGCCRGIAFALFMIAFGLLPWIICFAITAWMAVKK